MQALSTFGYNIFFEDQVKSSDLKDCIPGRIIAQYRERYVVQSQYGTSDAEVTGRLRYIASSNLDFPAVGDWVLLMQYEDLSLIHQVLSRRTVLERKAVGKSGETQLIAVNIDYAMIVQSLDSNFNINRLERYLSIVHEGGIEPIVILNKTDLVSESDLHEKLDLIEKRIGRIPCLSTSVISGKGISDLKDQFMPGKTYCFIGSSGVGKSSLINEVIGKNHMLTNRISDSTHKGRHTTSHRELLVLDQGGILIDTPGMRELGVTGSGDGIRKTFSQIDDLAASCKFTDCTHTKEPGCALQDALSKGIIDQAELDHFLRLRREAKRFTQSKAEKRSLDRKFGRLYKEIMRRKNSTK